MFCTLIFPARYYHLLCNDEDEDNDSSDILKCSLKAALFYGHRNYLIPTASLIVGTAFVLILEEDVRGREVECPGHARPAGEWQSPTPRP